MIHCNKFIIRDFTFPGGEEHIRLVDEIISTMNKEIDVEIKVRLTTSSDVIKLLMVVDALRRLNNKVKIHLFMPYVPYARQDRVCNKGEALSIKVFCDLINSMNFETVRILDPHSDVAPSLLNNCKVESIENYLSVLFLEQSKFNDKVIVCPDGGAIKRSYKFCKFIENEKLIFANKKRNTLTGEIEGIEVDIPLEYQGKDFLIFDDICDGGRTFIELGKKLKEKGAKSIDLLVSHGIFSKGFDVFDGIIDHIYSTNSFLDFMSNDYLTCIDIF
ncbi:MAG: ribose-phosphate diphosphokinase [Candidatus Paceibacterota bacterium]|jgi:ribose-phosphate pyrophosphokinase